MSDTPETDASCGYALSSHYGRLEGSYLQMDRNGPFVHAEVARKFERERDESREALKHIGEYGTEEINAAIDLRQKLASALVERDEAREAFVIATDQMVIAQGNVREANKQRDEALMDRARGETATMTINHYERILRERDEWSAMCGRYKQERDIAEQDATNYHARIIELIDERDKTKRERDEAREQANYWKSQYELEKGLYVIELK